jgi:hypothetical protein
MMVELTGYYLIQELMLDGKAGLFPDIEPINEQFIIEELKRITGVDLGRDRLGWLDWIINNDSHLKISELNNLKSLKRIIIIEKKLYNLLQSRQQT